MESAVKRASYALADRMTNCSVRSKGQEPKNQLKRHTDGPCVPETGPAVRRGALWSRDGDGSADRRRVLWPGDGRPIIYVLRAPQHFSQKDDFIYASREASETTWPQLNITRTFTLTSAFLIF